MACSRLSPGIINDLLQHQIPVALTIAGSDSSAGAGIQADLKTFSALGVYGLTAVTCVVAETPGKVTRIEPVPARTVRKQIDLLCANFPVSAIKTGLLCSAELVTTVARAMVELSDKADTRIALVVDPVMVATSGTPLVRAEAIKRYQSELFPLASLITPNLVEAGKLLRRTIDDFSGMRKAGKDLEKRYGVPILLKGGHLNSDQAIDLLFCDDNVVDFQQPFVRDVSTHGTGCTYSAAITAGLAVGLRLEDAIERAKKFVTSAIAKRFRWQGRSGADIDALNHFAQDDGV
ncbi:MAG TPA: bifunctional hydroxymethylpyrimidine kinase/phosphomethylpyrimidine kinase [Chthoniobacterales bacterium]